MSWGMTWQMHHIFPLAVLTLAHDSDTGVTVGKHRFIDWSCIAQSPIKRRLRTPFAHDFASFGCSAGGMRERMAVATASRPSMALSNILICCSAHRWRLTERVMRQR